VIEINEQLHSPDGQKCGGDGVASLGGTVGYLGVITDFSNLSAKMSG
jgi:hypothetical protein